MVIRITKVNNEEVKENVQFIGKIDRNKIGEYGKKIVTDNVVLTDERIKHIKEHHPELKDEEVSYVKKVLEDPEIILEDRKNVDTILMVKKIYEKEHIYRMVVKLNTNLEIKNKSNTIISFWKISEKKLGQYERNEKIIFKRLDKSE